MLDQMCLVEVKNNEVHIEINASVSFMAYAANSICRRAWDTEKDPEIRKRDAIPATLCALLESQKLTKEEKITILSECLSMIAEVG